ncbi:MAG TPA: PQQ-binding-like beta-propeller repeat protein [Pyrinomonadaceae bacterium]|nr:PQQ-binding-like beta-propeller repeat protein [Pyrinomonadaceae bacterium]
MRSILRRPAVVIFLALVLGVAACAARATNQTTPAAETNAAPPRADAPSSAQPTATPTPAEVTAAAAAAATDPNAATVVAASVEWPQWRGPNRDGVVAGASAPVTWPKELKEQWRVTVGVGHSSPVVSEGRVYQFARQGEEEVLIALDAATGKELWKAAGLPAPYEMNPAARGHGKGPKSTPVVADGRVFTLGITGVLSAHDAKTGRLVWRKDFSKQYPVTSPLYGTAMSPLVEGGLLVAHVGGHDRGALTAFDPATGAVRWSYDADGPAYSSPIVFTAGGERQIVTFTQKEFVSVSAATGKLLWKLPAKTMYDTNCNTAVAYKDTIIFSPEGKGIVAVRPVRQGGAWAAQEVWANAENELYMSSPVLHGNILFGLSARKKGQFFALDAATGKTLWQGEGRAGENAALLNLGGTLLALTNDAVLLVLPADAKAFAPAARYTVAASPTWAHPVFLGDRILVKDETTLASLSLK